MSIDQILSELRSERDRLDQAIAALDGNVKRPGRPTSNGVSGRRRRHMSVAAREKISRAMKARWASGKMKGRRKTA
jgi:hypothetical protein